MRRLLRSLALLTCLCPAVAAAEEGLIREATDFGVEITRDKFTNESDVSWMVVQDAIDGRHDCSFAVTWHQGIEPRVTFVFISYAGWRYPDEDTIFFLVDGSIRFPGPFKHKGHVRNGYLDEFAAVTPSPKEMRALANAKTVEIKIGGDEYTLSPKDLKAINLVYRVGTAIFVKSDGKGKPTSSTDAKR